MPKSVLILGFVLLCPALENASAAPLVFYASSPGYQTRDQGEGGGNPFASALIEILGRTEMRLADFPQALRNLTAQKSRGFQNADVPETVSPPDWRLIPPRTEKRVALVLVVSDYSKSGAESLPGAKHDAGRVAQALTRAGFETGIALNLDLQKMREKLNSFAVLSSSYDAAAIYTTGHGLEAGGVVYLLSGDYPLKQGIAALHAHALALPEIANSAHAKLVNLVFYGGCRDDPFPE